MHIAIMFFLVVALTLTASPADAAPPVQSLPAFHFEYPVKFVCGFYGPIELINDEFGEPRFVLPVARGLYLTSVNVHNLESEAGVFRFRLAVEFGSESWASVPIAAHAGESVGCREIRHWEGYVILQSTVELDVTALYSARPIDSGSVNTMHVLPIPGGKIKKLTGDPAAPPR